MAPTDHGNWSRVGTWLLTEDSSRILPDQGLLERHGTSYLLSVASSFPSYRKRLVCQRSSVSFLLLESVSQGMDSLFLSVWGRCFSSRLYKILGYRGKVVQARPQWGVPLIRMQKVSVSVGNPSVEVSYGCFAHNRCSVKSLLFLCSGLLWCQRVEFPFPEPCELVGGGVALSGLPPISSSGSASSFFISQMRGLD